MIDDGIIHDGSQKPQKLFLTNLAHHTTSKFDFHGKQKSTTRKSFLFTLRIWKQYWKILFLSRIVALWKWFIDFQFFHKNADVSKIIGTLGTNWYIFWKALMVFYTLMQWYGSWAKMTPPPRTSVYPKKSGQFLTTESPLKMMKNVFYFTLKALFVLKIFKFLSWLFSHV